MYLPQITTLNSSLSFNCEKVAPNSTKIGFGLPTDLIFIGQLWSQECRALVAQYVKGSPAGLVVLGLSPAGGDLFSHKGDSIAYRLSLSPVPLLVLI